MTVKPVEPLDFIQRLKAVQAFRQLPDAESLAATNKRISNILKKSESHRLQVWEHWSKRPKKVAARAQQSAADIQPLLAQRDYQATLTRLAQFDMMSMRFLIVSW